MSLGTSKKTIAGTFDSMQASCSILLSVADRMISQIDLNALTYIEILDQMLPQMRRQMDVLQDSALFPQAWIDGLDAYAKSQQEAPSDDFVGDYEAVRSACLATIELGLKIIPKGDGGAVLERTIDADGIATKIVVTDTAALKANLSSLVTALG